MLNFKNKLTPYEGRTISGKVARTFVRGQLVYDASVSSGFDGLAPIGELL